MRDSLLMRLEPMRRHLAVWRAAWALEKLAPRLPSRSPDELAFLPAAVEIVETPASPLGRGTLWLVAALFSSILLWACLGKADIHATAQGRIITEGKTKPVAASEAATVSAIHVADGDRVMAGQVLIELDSAAPEADAERLEREQAEELVAAARLRALLDGKGDFAAPAGVPEPLAEMHRQQVRQKLADHKASLEALEQEKHQKEAEQRAAQADIVRLEQTVPLLDEQARTRHDLSEQGYQSRTEYLRVEQERIDRTQELETARHKLAETRSAIANVGERLRQSEAQFRGEAYAQLAEAEQKAASLGQELSKARDRRRLFQLTAPVAGIVQQMAVHAPGAVVGQAQPLLMIVPENEGIAVEAALPNRDAGFVRAGQPVEIKVESFPFTRYGTIPGTVQTVSADAVQGSETDSQPSRRGASLSSAARSGEAQEPVYSVRIALERDRIEADGRQIALTPGMAVTAEIKTGRRRIIDYLLDPVLRYRDESLRER